MGPGPINADPRVLRAMSAQLVGQYDPWMTDTMNEVMELYRQVFVTDNRHTEATTMLYGARECARVLLQEGLADSWARHDLHGRAMLAGASALGLAPFGDLVHKMTNVVGVAIPDGVNGDAVRGAMLEDFGIEIGTSFGPLHGKIWRIGTMGYNVRADAVLTTLAALEAVLRRAGHRAPAGAGVDAAYEVYGASA